MIKLCIVLDNLDIGGTQKIMLDVAREIDKSLFEVKIIVLYESTGFNLSQRAGNLKLIYLGLRDNINIPLICLQIYGYIKDSDLILFSGLDSSLYLSIIRYFLRNIWKFINVVHGVDGYFIEDELLRQKYKKLNRFCVFKEKYLLNVFLKSVDHFIVMCDSLSEYLVNIRNVSRNKIKRIYFGTKFDEIPVFSQKALSEERRLLGMSDSDFVICYSGRLTYAKGLENIIEVFSRISRDHKKVKLLLSGDGELKEHLFNEKKKYNLEDKVVITGYTFETDKHIQLSDLYLLPSKSESTNLGVQSAMYFGKIVVTSDAGGLNEIIEDRKNGFLFRVGDYDEMFRILTDILVKKDSFSCLKRNAVESVSKKFNLKVNIHNIEKELIRIYNENRILN